VVGCCCARTAVASPVARSARARASCAPVMSSATRRRRRARERDLGRWIVNGIVTLVLLAILARIRRSGRGRHDGVDRTWPTGVVRLLWVVLVEGDPAYFAYALLAVPVAVAAAWCGCPRPDAPGAGPHPRLRRLLALLGLLAWLGVESVRGGVDVARRSLSRPVRVDPVEVVVQVRLAAVPAPSRSPSSVSSPGPSSTRSGTARRSCTPCPPTSTWRAPGTSSSAG
jgi:hypothetical protein